MELPRAVPSLGVVASSLSSTDALFAIAREAEVAGWPALWLIETEYDSFALAEAVALATHELVTGSCVARSYARHPLLVAETAAAVDRLAPGRFVIGLGTGGVRTGPPLPRQRWGAAADRPVERMREYLEVVRRGQAQETLAYDGEFFRFGGVTPELSPTSPVPIFLGARRPRMLQLAGETADGVFLWLTGEEATRHALADVRAGAAAAGRSTDEPRIGALIPLCLAADDATARAAIRRHLVDRYLGRASYADVLEGAGFPDAGARVRTLLAEGRNDAAAAAIPNEALAEVAVAGTAASCRAQLDAWLARGIDVPVLCVFPPDGEWDRAYRAVVRELAPDR